MTENHPGVRAEGAPTPRTGDDIPVHAQPAVRLSHRLGPQLGQVVPSSALDFDDEPEPEKPRRRGRVLMMTAAVLAASLVAAGITLGPTAARIMSQKDAVLATPDEAAGMTRLTSAEADDTVDSLLSVLASGIELDSYAGAIYVDPTKGTAKSVMLFGGTALLLRPERELDTVYETLVQSVGGSGLEEVDAGSLGGVMKCGSADGPDGIMSICGWADHGSMAFAFFPARNVEDSATLMRALRTATLSR